MIVTDFLCRVRYATPYRRTYTASAMTSVKFFHYVEQSSSIRLMDNHLSGLSMGEYGTYKYWEEL